MSAPTDKRTLKQPANGGLSTIGRLVRCVRALGLSKGVRYWRIENLCIAQPAFALQWADALESEALSHEASGVTQCVPSLRGFAADIRHHHALFTARDPNMKNKKPILKLSLEPCGDCWLHIDAPSGKKASINLGQRGTINDQTIVGSVIREVSELQLMKTYTPSRKVRCTKQRRSARSSLAKS